MEYIASQYQEVDDDTLEVTYTWGVYARTSRCWVAFCETEEEARNRAAQLNGESPLRKTRTLKRKRRTLKITIEYDSHNQVDWDWGEIFPDFNVIVEPFEPFED